MTTKTIQKTFDDIAAHLKGNATDIGARDAYEQMAGLIDQLNKTGFEITEPDAWDSDIKPVPTPGW